MRLVEFTANGWRNLQSLSFTPHPGLNVLYGENAQGKTNLLEAIYYAATLRSFRAARPLQLIAWGEEAFRLKARAEVGGLSTHLAVRLSREGRRLRVDGAPVEAVDDYFGGFNVVLFTPEHLGLVRGEPAGRRQFMDRALFNVETTQLQVVRRYNRILRERNACLKRYGDRPGLAGPLLDALDPQLAEVGARLVVRRQQLLTELEPGFGAIHGAVSGGDKPVGLRYRARGLTLRRGAGRDASPEDPAAEGASDAPEDEPPVTAADPADGGAHAQRLAQALVARRDEDLRRGFTTVGPHQDDLDVRLAGRPARTTASQGEARTLVLALKLAEVDYVRERRSEAPVLLLDDLGSELDAGRREILYRHVLGLGCQTFLTTVVPESLPDRDKHVYFKIDNGSLTPDP